LSIQNCFDKEAEFEGLCGLMDLGGTNLSPNIVLTSSLLKSYAEVGYHYLVILDVLFKIN
jgi:hypothetical protein